MKSVEKGYLESKHKTILFILDAALADWKGTQRFIYGLGKYLTSHSYNVVVIENTSRYMSEKQVPDHREIPFKVISCRFRRFLGVGFVPKKEIFSVDPDVIYVCFLNSNPFVPTLGYKTVLGSHILHLSFLKYASTRHKINFWVKSLILTGIALVFWGNKKIYFHALTEDQQNWISAKTNRRYPIFTIGNPVECCNKDEIDMINYDVSKKFKILFFGSFSKDKGFDRFLQILEIIESSSLGREIDFIIAGAGELIKDINVPMGKYRNIKFIDRPTDEQKYQLFHCSDLLVYPSLMDIYPFTLAEAQIHGLPVIAADTIKGSGIVIDGQTGYILSQNSIDEFISRIDYYYGIWKSSTEDYYNLRMEIIRKSKRLCEQNILPRYFSLFESVLTDDRGT